MRTTTYISLYTPTISVLSLLYNFIFWIFPNEHIGRSGIVIANVGALILGLVYRLTWSGYHLYVHPRQQAKQDVKLGCELYRGCGGRISHYQLFLGHERNLLLYAGVE